MEPADLETLADLAGWAENELAVTGLSEAQIELIAELDASRREALIDPLTQIWNRRGIMQVLERELSRSSRASSALGVLMVDIDHFKRCNDTHGHPAGDAVLQEAAARMRASIRAYDALGRYGGEEFLVVATGVDREGLLSIAEKMRQRVEREEFHTAAASLRITVSLGAASMEAGAGVEELIARADAALYRAKNGGRNRTVFDEG
jgi:diguanylate cyclase (GGDEF)-like protein